MPSSDSILVVYGLIGSIRSDLMGKPCFDEFPTVYHRQIAKYETPTKTLPSTGV